MTSCDGAASLSSSSSSSSQPSAKSPKTWLRIVGHTLSRSGEASLGLLATSRSPSSSRGAWDAPEGLSSSVFPGEDPLQASSFSSASHKILNLEMKTANQTHRQALVNAKCWCWFKHWHCKPHFTLVEWPTEHYQNMGVPAYQKAQLCREHLPS